MIGELGDQIRPEHHPQPLLRHLDGRDDVGVLGLGWEAELLPEDVSKMDVVLEKWKNDGFVREFDVKTAVLIVDPARWNERKRVEKMNIVTQLARYCAEKNRTPSFLLRVQPTAGGPVLAEMGPRGLRVP